MTSRGKSEGRRRGRRRRACAALALAAVFASWAAGPARAQADAPAAQAKDGPARIVYGGVYKEGPTTFEEVKPEEVGPLPFGYAHFNHVAYRLRTEAVVVGPHVLDFRLPSVTDRNLFAQLRVLCAEWDRIDQKAFWADCTSDEGPRARDFETRTLRARVERQRVYLVARRVEPPRPVTTRAELSVEIVAPKEPAVANRDLVYEIRVTNRGPEDAPGLELHGAGFSSSEFVRMTAPARGGGRCRQDGSNFGCRLDLLEKKTTASFFLTARPYESPRLREPRPGSFDLTVYVAAPVIDTNERDDRADSHLTVAPDPNRAPAVRFVAPREGEIFPGPTRVRLAAEATDVDGSVTKVTFYDGERLLGEGVPAGGQTFTLDWPEAAPGAHLLTVVATDDGGRADDDMRRVVVNGPLSVKLDAPEPDAVFKVRTTLRDEYVIERGTLGVTAQASVGPRGAEVREVVFHLLNQSLPGAGTTKTAAPSGTDAATGAATYSVTFDDLGTGAYSLSAVATDGRGLQSLSESVHFRVSPAPAVRLKAARLEYEAPARVELSAEARVGDNLGDPAAARGRIDFFADGRLVGSVQAGGFTGWRRGFVWEHVAAGVYHITAVAVDGDGVLSPPSNALRITVR